MKFRTVTYACCIIVCVFITVSCNNLKKLPAGDALYTGSSVKIDSTSLKKKEKKTLEGELQSLTRPNPNKKILGMRFKLSMYNLAGNPKKENSLRGWLKNKVGEPPILLIHIYQIQIRKYWVCDSNCQCIILPETRKRKTPYADG